MSIGEKIALWLEGNGSFQEGVALLEELGQPVYEEKAWLARPFVPSSKKEKLRRRLKPFQGEKRATTEPMGKVPATEPAVITDYRAKGRRLLKEYSEAKGRLNMMVIGQEKYDDEDRYQLAAFIMDELTPRIDEVYNAIRRYQQSGETPQPLQTDIVRETVEKMQRLQSLAPRISRLKKWLEKGGLEEEKRKKYEIELKEKEAEQESLRIELGL